MNITSEDVAKLASMDPDLATRLVVLQAQWDFALTLHDPVDRATAMDGIRDGHGEDSDWADWRRFRDAKLAQVGFPVEEVA